MEIKVITIFPDFFEYYSNFGLLKAAKEKGLFSFKAINLRDFTTDRHKTTDDTPYGGGAGMVFKAEPLVKAIKNEDREFLKIYLSPKGKIFNQSLAKKLLAYDKLLFITSRYEGIDERVLDYIDLEISLGDFILSSGEIGVLIILDTILRLIPGILGNEESLKKESFEENLLEYPQYTKPVIYEEKEVPQILLSGHHKMIEKYRREESLKRTLIKRPDLLLKADLLKEDIEFLDSFINEIEKILEEKKQK